MMVRRLGGFRFGRRLVGVWRWVLRRRPRRRYLRLSPRPEPTPSVARQLAAWGRCLTRRIGARAATGDCYRDGDGTRHDLPLLGEEEMPPPKGHLAVYVGGGRKDEGGPPQRYLVPVIYFNHPLFGELLREAEAEFGFQHPGGITIPCPVSKFERVQTRIAAGRKSGARSLF